MNHVAMIVRDDAYDRILTPLTFAHSLAQKGTRVDMLFVLWAVRALTAEGAEALKVSASHADQEEWLRQQLRDEGEPTGIAEFIKEVAGSGEATLYGCRYAARTFGVEPGSLIPQAEAIVDPAWFLTEIVAKADHCQYF